MIRFDVNFNLDGLTENVAKIADDTQRKAAMELQGELIEITPRDTSRARAGWLLDTLNNGFVPPKGQTTYTPQRQQAPKGAPFVLVFNNVEYIVRLNEGHSTQQPARFVQAAVDKIARNIK